VKLPRAIGLTICAVAASGLHGVRAAGTASAAIVLHDARRHKDLPVTVVYGSCGAPCPFIVFSHGAGGSPQGYVKLAADWAGHGYVVALPQHDDSIALRRATRAGDTSMLGVLAQARNDPDGWRNRVADLAEVVDSVADIEREIPALRDRIDASRIGVGGHSYGAYATQVAAGALVTFPGEARPTSLRLDAPRAFLMMSPQGPGELGLTDASWSRMDRPFMVMTGTYDSLTLRGTRGWQWRRSAYAQAPPGDKYFAFFVNANHMSFTDRPSAGRGLLGGLLGSRGGHPDGETIQRHVFELSVLWWNAYLKGDAAARRQLRSGALEQSTGGEVTIAYK
jgi:dienelactone hydrolase